MQVAGNPRLIGVVAGMVLLSILAVFVAPGVSVLPAHSRVKRTASHYIGSVGLSAAVGVALQSVRSSSPPGFTLEHPAPAAPVLSLICVRIC